MKNLKPLLLFISFQIITNELFSQKIIDSIIINNHPVLKGVIYQYDYSSVFRNLCGEGTGVSILTENDSVFHHEKGNVVGIHFYMDVFAIVIRNEKNEFFSYSNLKASTVCKGEIVQKGTFLGLTGKMTMENYSN